MHHRLHEEHGGLGSRTSYGCGVRVVSDINAEIWTQDLPWFSAIEARSIISTAVTTIRIAIAINVTMAVNVTVSISSLSITGVIKATTSILACEVIMGGWAGVPTTAAVASIPRHFDVLVDRVSRVD